MNEITRLLERGRKNVKVGMLKVQNAFLESKKGEKQAKIAKNYRKVNE